MNTRQNLIVFRLSACCGLRRLGDLRPALCDVETVGPHPQILIPESPAKRWRPRTVPLWWDRDTLADIEAWKRERIEAGAQASDPLVCSQHKDTRGKNALGTESPASLDGGHQGSWQRAREAAEHPEGASLVLLARPGRRANDHRSSRRRRPRETRNHVHVRARGPWRRRSACEAVQRRYVIAGSAEEEQGTANWVPKLRRAPFGSDFGELSRAEPQGRRQSSRGKGLEPPNGGGTSCIDGVSPPFGGFCHPHETDIHGLTPRGQRSVAPPGQRREGF